jgi:hypothetical protein
VAATVTPLAAALAEAENTVMFVQTAKDILAEMRSKLQDSLAKDVAIEVLIGQYRDVIDTLVKAAWQRHMPANTGMALVATGGYGRGELYPHSDIDLLLCGDAEAQAEAAAAIAAMYSLLWDCGLKLGQAVRSVEQCMQESRADVATYTCWKPVCWPVIPGNIRICSVPCILRMCTIRWRILKPSAMNSASAMPNTTTPPTIWNPTSRKGRAVCAISIP